MTNMSGHLFHPAVGHEERGALRHGAHQGRGEATWPCRCRLYYTILYYTVLYCTILYYKLEQLALTTFKSEQLDLNNLSSMRVSIRILPPSEGPSMTGPGALLQG